MRCDVGDRKSLRNATDPAPDSHPDRPALRPGAEVAHSSGRPTLARRHPMRTADTTPEGPYLMAVFDTPAEADQALARLRAFGFPDHRVRCLPWEAVWGEGGGGRTYWLAGVILGAALGAVLVAGLSVLVSGRAFPPAGVGAWEMAYGALVVLLCACIGGFV